MRMSFNWEEFIYIAKFLHNDHTCPPEAKCRSAINRAYYGAFGSVRKYANELGCKENDQDLRKIQIYLNTYKDSIKVNLVISDLLDLMEWQKRCDSCEDLIMDIEELSDNAQSQADSIINKLKVL